MTSSAALVSAIIGGAATWQAVAWLGGRREAWDSPLYWLIGYPLALVVSGVLAYQQPIGAWRWALAFMWSQAVVMTLSADSFGLLPLGLIMFGILGIPPMIVAVIVGKNRRRGADTTHA